MSSGSSQATIDVIRGDTFSLFVGLSEDWGNIVAAPGNYVGRLVFREDQSDLAPELLVMTAVPALADDIAYPTLDLIMEFAALPSATQALPSYDIFCFCEVKDIPGNYVKRLFNGKVRIRD